VKLLKWSFLKLSSAYLAIEKTDYYRLVTETHFFYGKLDFCVVVSIPQMFFTINRQFFSILQYVV